MGWSWDQSSAAIGWISCTKTPEGLAGIYRFIPGDQGNFHPDSEDDKMGYQMSAYIYIFIYMQKICLYIYICNMIYIYIILYYLYTYIYICVIYNNIQCWHVLKSIQVIHMWYRLCGVNRITPSATRVMVIILEKHRRLEVALPESFPISGLGGAPYLPSGYD